MFNSIIDSVRKLFEIEETLVVCHQNFIYKGIIIEEGFLQTPCSLEYKDYGWTDEGWITHCIRSLGATCLDSEFFKSENYKKELYTTSYDFKEGVGWAEPGRSEDVIIDEELQMIVMLVYGKALKNSSI